VLGQGSFISTPQAAENPAQPSPEVEALYAQLTSITQELVFRGQKIEDIVQHISSSSSSLRA